MSQPVFRNPDKFQVLPFREWLRANMPNGSDGFVVEDLDLVLRGYGPKYHTDAQGKVMLIELKYSYGIIGRAQKMTFGLMDNILHVGDPERLRYRGYYVVNYTDEDWDKACFTVNNRVTLTKDEFIDFLSFGRDDIKCFFDYQNGHQ